MKFVVVAFALLFVSLSRADQFDDTTKHLSTIETAVQQLIDLSGKQETLSKSDVLAADAMKAFLTPVNSNDAADTKKKMDALETLSSLSPRTIQNYAHVLDQISTDNYNTDLGKKARALSYHKLLFLAQFPALQRKSKFGDSRFESYFDYSLAADAPAPHVSSKDRVKFSSDELLKMKQTFADIQTNRALCPAPSRTKLWRDALTTELVTLEKAASDFRVNSNKAGDEVDALDEQIKPLTAELEALEKKNSKSQADAFKKKLVPLLKEIFVGELTLTKSDRTTESVKDDSGYWDEYFNRLADHMMTLGDKWNGSSLVQDRHFYSFNQPPYPDYFYHPTASGVDVLRQLTVAFNPLPTHAVPPPQIVPSIRKVAVGRISEIDALLKEWTATEIPAVREKIAQADVKRSELVSKQKAVADFHSATRSTSIDRIRELKALLAATEECAADVKSMDAKLRELSPENLTPHALESAQSAVHEGVRRTKPVVDAIRAYNRK